MIPDVRHALSIRGEMGVGKTRNAAFLCKLVAEAEGLYPVRIWIREGKLPSSEHFYREQLGYDDSKVRIYTHNLIYPFLSRLRKCVVVIDDAPMWMSTKSQNTMTALATGLARQNELFVIITTQKPQALPTRLNIHLDGKFAKDPKDNRYFYSVSERTKSTKWIEWTGRECSEVLNYIYEGVEGSSLSRVGRPHIQDSKKRRAFVMFKDGMSNIEVAGELGMGTGSIAVYRHLMKEEDENDFQL